MTQTPAYWDGARWIVHSRAPLTQGQLGRIAEWLLPVQRQRRLGLAAGPVRDDLDESVKALVGKRIVCGLAPEYKGFDGQQYAPFAATAGTGKIMVGAGD